jgi:hypothetical protein
VHRAAAASAAVNERYRLVGSRGSTRFKSVDTAVVLLARGPQRRAAYDHRVPARCCGESRAGAGRGTALAAPDVVGEPAVLVAARGEGDSVHVEVDVQVGQVEVQSVPERASLSRERAAAATGTSTHNNSCSCRRAACVPGQE